MSPATRWYQRLAPLPCGTSRLSRACSTAGVLRPSVSSGGARGSCAAMVCSGGANDQTHLLVLHPGENQSHLDRPAQPQLTTQLIGIQAHPALLDRDPADVPVAQPRSKRLDIQWH